MELTWTCSIQLQECEAYALALCLRLRGSAYKDGTEMKYKERGEEPLEIALTKELAKEVLPHYSYLRHKIRCNPYVFRKDHVPPLILSLTREHAEAEIMLSGWTKTNEAVVKQTEADLEELVEAGFVCRG